MHPQLSSLSLACRVACSTVLQAGLLAPENRATPRAAPEPAVNPALMSHTPAAVAPSDWLAHFRAAAQRVDRMLHASPSAEAAVDITAVASVVTALVERQPDLAILLVVQQEACAMPAHGVSHALRTAFAALLVAQRLGWDNAARQRACAAALTMNWSIVDLQDVLARQPDPPNAAQRVAIRQHPLHSAERLRACGIDDAVWLDAIEQHHEQPGGKGYPARLQDSSELARLLWRADVYTAKLSTRATRGALTAAQAARALFLPDEADPIVAALIAEFGQYPPGSCVKLATGETGVVVQRGAQAAMPRVAAMADARGYALPELVPRDASARGSSIVMAVNPVVLRLKLPYEALASFAVH